MFERYGQLGIRRLRTDVSGALTFEFGKEILVSEYRRAQRRYWQAQ